jgi:hypothetical protein
MNSYMEGHGNVGARTHLVAVAGPKRGLGRPARRAVGIGLGGTSLGLVQLLESK